MIKKLLGALLALFAAVAFAAVDANTAPRPSSRRSRRRSGALRQDHRRAQEGAVQGLARHDHPRQGVGEHNSVKFSTAGLTVMAPRSSLRPPCPRSQSDARLSAQVSDEARHEQACRCATAVCRAGRSGQGGKEDRCGSACCEKDTGAKAGAVDQPQSSAPVTAPAAKAMTAEERKAAKQKAKETRPRRRRKRPRPPLPRMPSPPPRTLRAPRRSKSEGRQAGAGRARVEQTPV